MCRLKVLNFWNARADYVSMYVVWMAYAGWVAFETWTDHRLTFEALPLVGALLWLEISWRDWLDGKPPKHVLKGKALKELEAEHLRHVHGGTKSP
jgi:hypothetical protein